jgi:membrane protease YdiL (CAAX protease family)
MTTETSTNFATASETEFPSIWVAAIWVIIFFALQILISAFAIGIAFATSDSVPDLAGTNAMKVLALPTIWGLVISNLITCLGLWVYLRKENRFAKIGFYQWSNISWIVTLAIALAVIFGGIGFNYVYTEYIFPGVEMQEQLKLLFNAIPKTWPNSILLFLAVAVFAPLLEEFLFRGLLQKSLMPMMPAAAAILLSAAIFAGVHMDMMAFAPIFVLGAGFGYLYHVTGSLRVCILMHMINNGAALALS